MQAIVVATRGRGLHCITSKVAAATKHGAKQLAAGNGSVHLCNVFVQHTSCSLLIQENADPSARHDLERWLERCVPDGEPFYTHTAEGPDDMPSHVKAMLLPVSLSIPVLDGNLQLGTWQGIYLFEHRLRGSSRRMLVTVN